MEPPEGLYSPSTETGFVPNTARGFASVSAEHVRGYGAQGFLVIEDAFSPSQVKEALDAVDGYCSERDSEFRTACNEFVKRYSAREAAKGRDGPGIQFEPAAAGKERGGRSKFVRKLKNFHNFDETILGTMSKDEGMLDVVRKLIYGATSGADDCEREGGAGEAGEAEDGSTSTGERKQQKKSKAATATAIATATATATATASGVAIKRAEKEQPLEFFQSTALLKPPRVGREKPWHQYGPPPNRHLFNSNTLRGCHGPP